MAQSNLAESLDMAIEEVASGSSEHQADASVPRFAFESAPGMSPSREILIEKFRDLRNIITISRGGPLLDIRDGKEASFKRFDSLMSDLYLQVENENRNSETDDEQKVVLIWIMDAGNDTDDQVGDFRDILRQYMQRDDDVANWLKSHSAFIIANAGAELTNQATGQLEGIASDFFAVFDEKRSPVPEPHAVTASVVRNGAELSTAMHGKNGTGRAKGHSFSIDNIANFKESIFRIFESSERLLDPKQGRSAFSNSSKTEWSIFGFEEFVA